MNNYISQRFGELGITIDRAHILNMSKFMINWEQRKTNPLTLNGPYLGIDPISFTTSDYNAFFDIVGIREKDLEVVIRGIPTIDRNFLVSSNPFNLLAMWLVHLSHIYIKDKHVRHDYQMAVLKIYHYRIFTSCVTNSFRHGTNKGIMEATVSTLSRKSDIVKYESWKKLIEEHCEKILNKDDRFLKTLIEGGPDNLFLRVISETQTALRAKIVTFAQAYYLAHSAGDSVGFRSSVAENSDGEKIIAQAASVIDSAVSSMVSEVLNSHMFINDVSVDDISKLFTTISSRMLKTALLKINETAVLQTSNKSFDKVHTSKEGVLYIGVRALINEIIRSMVGLCREKRVNMGDAAEVFKTMKDAYSSSRISDPNILAVRRSVAELVDPFNITSNLASQSTLRLSVIYYIIYRTILKMKT